MEIDDKKTMMDRPDVLDYLFNNEKIKTFINKLAPFAPVIVLINAFMVLVSRVTGGDFSSVLSLTRYAFPFGILLCLIDKRKTLLTVGFAVEALCALANILHMISLAMSLASMVGLIISFILYFMLAVIIDYSNNQYIPKVIRSCVEKVKSGTNKQNSESGANVPKRLPEYRNDNSNEHMDYTTCQNCGSKLRHGARFCAKCGTSAEAARVSMEVLQAGTAVTEAEPAAVTVHTAVIEQDTEHSMNAAAEPMAATDIIGNEYKNKTEKMKCLKCGREAKNDQRFCVKCGSELVKIEEPVRDHASDTKFCTKCGASIKADHTFCVKCGNKVG